METTLSAEQVQEQYAESKGYNSFYELIKADLKALDYHVQEVQKEYARIQIQHHLNEERKMMIDFHIGVMKQGLIEEGEEKWTDDYLPKITEIATRYYDSKFIDKQSITSTPINLK